MPYRSSKLPPDPATARHPAIASAASIRPSHPASSPARPDNVPDSESDARARSSAGAGQHDPNHDQVNAAIGRHIKTENMQMVIVAQECEEWKKRLLAGEPSPMKYNSPKPDEILEEDKIVEKWKIDLKPENVRIVPVEQVFE
jgi:hypothetical protein